MPSFFYAFGPESGDASLDKVDDGFSPAIPLGIDFPFFGTTETVLHVRFISKQELYKTFAIAIGLNLLI